MTEDFYELLGVNKTANEAELKSAYKKAARKFHPDNAETGNEELFKKVGAAYEVLKDPQKRQIYYQYGAEGLKGAGGFGGAGAEGFGGFEDLGDIFSSFFGGGFSGGGAKAQNRPTKGQDHEVSIQIDFMDAIEDKAKKIRLNPLDLCKSCNGKGAENASDVSTCGTCNGAGQVMSLQNTVFGQVRQTSTCPSCHGSGKFIKNPCKPCNGRGYKRETKEIEVTIPAGINDGTTMRLSGQGDVGKNGGPRGDIYLVVRVRSHDKFKRDGADIYSTVKVGFAEAALGHELEIPTIYGEQKLKIKPGTQSHEVYTIKEAGMPVINRKNRKGDQYVNVEVVIPNNLSKEEKKLLEEFQKLRRDKDIKV